MQQYPDYKAMEPQLDEALARIPELAKDLAGAWMRVPLVAAHMAADLVAVPFLVAHMATMLMARRTHQADGWVREKFTMHQATNPAHAEPSEVAQSLGDHLDARQGEAESEPIEPLRRAAAAYSPR